MTDSLVDDIVITHDCSDDYVRILDTFTDKKIRIYKNINNWHILHNKRNSIYHAKNDWVICIDSDNSIGHDYTETLRKEKKTFNTIYAPEFARPKFDYRCYSGMILKKSTIAEFDKHTIFQCFLNTFNYCLNRKEYLKVYQYTTRCNSADSIYFNYIWLKVGNNIKVVEGLQYNHRVHQNSTFLKEYEKSLNMANIYMNKIKAL